MVSEGKLRDTASTRRVRKREVIDNPIFPIFTTNWALVLLLANLFTAFK